MCWENWSLIQIIQEYFIWRPIYVYGNSSYSEEFSETHPEYITLFHGNNVYVNAPHCYVVRMLHVLLTYIVCVAEPGQPACNIEEPVEGGVHPIAGAGE